jgi:hypothetical protein
MLMIISTPAIAAHQILNFWQQAKKGTYSICKVRADKYAKSYKMIIRLIY